MHGGLPQRFKLSFQSGEKDMWVNVHSTFIFLNSQTSILSANYHYSDGSSSEFLLRSRSASFFKKVLGLVKGSHVSWAEKVHLSEGRAFFYTHVLKDQTDPVVLEVGCGCGALTKELAAASLRVDAVESSSSRINIAKSNCRGLSNIDFYNKLTKTDLI